MFKLTAILIALATVVGLGVVIDSDSRQQPADAPAPVDFASSPIHASGRVEGATDEIELRPELHARVVEILVHEGQRVAAGEALIRLDGAEQEYHCASAEADLAVAEAELERLINGARGEERREAAADAAALEAQLNGVRQRRTRVAALLRSRATTDQELDDLNADIKRLAAQLDAARARHQILEAPAREDEVRRARAKVAAAEAQLKLAQHECQKATLRAPLAAEVLKIGVELGELVGPDAAESTIIMSDTAKLYVRAYVDELDAPRVCENMPAQISADGMPGKQVLGRVVRMAPRMSRKPLRTDDPAERFDTKVREVWVELNETDRGNLVVGLPVDVVLGESQVERRIGGGEAANLARRYAERGQSEREDQ
ncbi:MAG TPA: HlyD family efflux transporter periplasmic adaptor subunit, partial [Pirellulales bacterium]|nr:HlyD family efflux transporter periplasmic adaptor subunit [Pirellulales bacterium]